MKGKDMVSIGMASCNLGVEGAKAMAELALVMTELTECNLRDNGLGEDGWCAIFDSLCGSPQNKITKWDLQGISPGLLSPRQGITPIIVKSLAAYMAVSTELTSLE